MSARASRIGLLLLGLAVPTLAAPWRQVPARGGAPAFRCRIQELPGGFRFEVELPPSAEDWAVQLWVADEGMVQRRRKAIAEVQTALRETRELLADPDHDGKDCQDAIHRFVAGAEEALRRLRGYDPFRQSAWSFGGEAGTSALAEHRLAEAGARTFTGDFRFDRDLDAAAPTIRRLAWGLALVPRAEPHPRAIRDPWTLVLNRPWALRPRLSPDQALLLKLAGSGILLASRDGYALAGPGEVNEVGCYGYEGTFSCPDIWKPIVAPAVRSEHPLPPDLRIVGLGPALAVHAEGRAWTVVDLAGRLSSAIEEGWEILDLRRGSRGDLYLLAQGSGASRPHGGSGPCGAGTEVDVAWAHIGPDGRVKGVQTVHVIQCDGPTGYGYDYDPSRPERGLRIKRVDPDAP